MALMNENLHTHYVYGKPNLEQDNIMDCAQIVWLFHITKKKVIYEDDEVWSFWDWSQTTATDTKWRLKKLELPQT